VIACFLASGVLIAADFRLRTPIEPILIVLAACALIRGYTGLERAWQAGSV
jgi:hypothetical protein